MRELGQIKVERGEAGVGYREEKAGRFEGRDTNVRTSSSSA